MADDPATPPVHRYAATVTWRGSTAPGYQGYDRAHVGTTAPAPGELELTADPAFLGTPDRHNPEQLLLLAAASCQLLSFLAVAARARLEVLAYDDDATAAMDEADRPTRVTEIVLRPRIALVAGPTEARVRRLVEVAHRECYIARSLATPITVEAAITFVDAPDAGRSGPT